MRIEVTEEAIRKLELVDGAVVQREKSLADMTTYRIGGVADVIVRTDTIPALEEAIRILSESGAPWVVLGGGSNTLVCDEGYRGCVIRLGGDFARCSIDGETMTAGGAVPLAEVVSKACKAKLSGLEQCTGIPGSVGGAIAMNAGTHLGTIANAVESVTIWSPERGRNTYARADLEWEYRKGPVNRDEIVLEVTFGLSSAPSGTIAMKMEDCRSYRWRTQPLGKPSCGSVFRNPPEGSVARMLDECELKGLQIGRAAVSRKHANFVLNMGGATASDVLHVMGVMHRVVRQRFGIDIQPEVRFLGFDHESLAAHGLA